MRSRTSVCSFRNVRAFSRPCPIRSPAKLNQDPDFSTTPSVAPRSSKSPSREILSNQNPLQISFTVAAKAFGVDLRAYAGYPATATVTVYAADNSTVLSTTTNLSLNTSGVPIFFGYQSAAGIGRVVLTNSGQSWSPIIDNLTFSTITEPPIALLLGG